MQPSNAARIDPGEPFGGPQPCSRRSLLLKAAPVVEKTAFRLSDRPRAHPRIDEGAGVSALNYVDAARPLGGGDPYNR
jgi:hypothetical protein